MQTQSKPIIQSARQYWADVHPAAAKIVQAPKRLRCKNPIDIDEDTKNVTHCNIVIHAGRECFDTGQEYNGTRLYLCDECMHRRPWPG